MSGARDFVPPILWRVARRARARVGRAYGAERHQPGGVAQPPAFYDRVFNESAHLKAHYTASRYYAIWTLVADRLRHARVRHVLDVGCGPGQVATLLRDRGDITAYTGVDFSAARISRAREICPEFAFALTDAMTTDCFEAQDYDCAVFLEFLEHVDQDRELIARVRHGALVLLTVPNFMAAGHVRCFDSPEAVAARYDDYLCQLDVVSVSANDRGGIYFVLQGIRR